MSLVSLDSLFRGLFWPGATAGAPDGSVGGRGLGLDCSGKGGLFGGLGLGRSGSGLRWRAAGLAGLGGLGRAVGASWRRWPCVKGSAAARVWRWTPSGSSAVE